jgi:hypothetical protein
MQARGFSGGGARNKHKPCSPWHQMNVTLHNTIWNMADDKHGGGLGDGDFYTRMKNLERQIEFIDLQVCMLSSCGLVVMPPAWNVVHLAPRSVAGCFSGLF